LSSTNSEIAASHEVLNSDPESRDCGARRSLNTQEKQRGNNSDTVVGGGGWRGGEREHKNGTSLRELCTKVTRQVQRGEVTTRTASRACTGVTSHGARQPPLRTELRDPMSSSQKTVKAFFRGRCVPPQTDGSRFPRREGSQSFSGMPALGILVDSPTGGRQRNCKIQKINGQKVVRSGGQDLQCAPVPGTGA